MASPSLNSTVIARLAQAVYGFKIGNATMNEAVAASNAVGVGVDGLMNALYARDLAGKSNADVAAMVVANLGITSAAQVTEASAYIKGQLDAAPAGGQGAALVSVVNLFSGLTTNANYGAFAKQFNTDITSAVNFGQTGGTLDIDLHGGLFNIDPAAAAGVMRLTGNLNARIDITRNDNQVTGLDLNRNGVIQVNGLENVNPTAQDDGKKFTVIDAYARNPLDATDSTHNYLGNISFDGTGFFGDGTKTNGNIFLGGLGSDIALGGIGNDFMAGGGAIVSNPVTGLDTTGIDDLSGGRNADFFFVELSRLSPTDGNNERIAGGTTSDDTVAATGPSGGLGTQDNDWILLEASDDDEPVTITLNEGTLNANGGANGTTASGRGFTNADIESLNASGNLYGFLNNVNTVVGSRAYDGNGDGYKAGVENYGRGSSAQLIINGSSVANAIIGGYDNDQINGNDGNDLLMGGDLRFLITNKNNPNLLDSKGGLNLTATAQGLVNDGKDNLAGGNGNDNIVFEADNGTISGDGDSGKLSGNTANGQINPATGVAYTSSDDRNYVGPRSASQGDALWLTDFSMGRVLGATLAGEGTAQTDAMVKLTTDSTFRMDLGGGANFKNYGGTNLTAATNSQDTTNYVGNTPTTASRVAVSGMESVNATGLGAIDYKAAGSNPASDQAFNNVQNYGALQTNVDLRGSGVDNVLLANTGNDTLEGRGGDDVLSGGTGKDTFVMALGDGVDWIARPVDANGDNIWDTTGGLTVAGGFAWGQDFRPPQAATAGTTTLVVDFGTTLLNGVDTFVATFQMNIDGVAYGTTIPAATLAAAKSTAEVASIVNAAYQALNSKVTVVATDATHIAINAIDSTPGDGILPVIGTTAATGFFVTGQASGAGTYQAKGTVLGASGTNLEDDRLVIKSYEDRSINLGTNQLKVETSQAAQFVTNFAAAGSSLVQGQASRIYLDGVREGDTVTVTINGQPYAYTLKAGENSTNASLALTGVINNFLDVNSASGKVAATDSPTSFGDVADVGAQQSGLLIQQTIVGNSQAYMNISAAVTRADGAAAFGSVATHNESATQVDILGFDARNGALTSQDAAGSPVVLFQGRNTGTTTTSLLLTAKDDGGALNGMDANLSTTVTNSWVNGDDLLIGGLGNDVISAGTGDDRVLMSKGVDSVDGGGNITNADGSTTTFQDVLQGEEATFGTGSRFKVTLDGTLGAAGVGKGTVAVFDAANVATGDVTTFTGIELVRVLENNRQSELDVKALSDSVAAAAASGPAGGIMPAEGLTINLLTNPAATNNYTVDLNGDGVLSPAETAIAITTVAGVENVTTGNANDTINVDESQLTASNKFTMGAQQGNEVTLVEGLDTVNYNYGALTAANRPVMTIAVTGMGAATVAGTGGQLAKAVFTDTLVGVEQVNVGAAATSDALADKLDVSGLVGVTVNYGSGEAVGKSLGGTDVAPTSVAQAEADTLQSGGVSMTGNGLGNELLQIGGITLIENVVGSTGSDRIILANSMQPGAVAAVAGNVAKNAAWFASPVQATLLGGAGAATQINDPGLYTFNLGAGNDSLDYKQETNNVTVAVDTTPAGDTDTVFIGGTNGERSDIAMGVERYYGGSAANLIDLTAATVDTTIQFSKEARSNAPANDVAEPQGNDGTVAGGETRGTEVRATGTTAALATFMERTGANDIGVAASTWQYVVGSNTLAETVILTDNEAGSSNVLSLVGGKNVVDYTAMSSTVTANIGSVNRSANTFQNQITSVSGTLDSIYQSINLDNANNYLTIVGTGQSGDTLNVAALSLVAVAPGTVGTSVNVGTLSSVSSGVLARHVVDMGAGTIREDIHGQYGDINGTVQSANFLTMESQFENATNAGDGDRVTLIGSGGINGLTGGTNNDVLLGGRGIAPVGSASTGDSLTGNAGNDWFVYTDEAESPFGSVTGNNQSSAIFGSGAAGDAAVLRAQDVVTDFTTGADKLVFTINSDDWNAVKVTAAIPANLAAVRASVTPVTYTLAAGSAEVHLPVTGAGALSAQSQDFLINTTAAMAAVGDLMFRVQMTSGGDVVDAGLGANAANLNAAANDTLAVVFVYSDKGQSQGGGFDQIINFTTGEDKIDLSFLRAPEWEARFGTTYDTNANNVSDAIEGIRTLPAAPLAAFNSDAPGLFMEGGAHRAVAVQTLSDGNGDPSTTIFIDVNHDGDYTVGQDMVLSLVGKGAPALGDFIFDNYDLLGLNNEIPGFVANATPGA